MLKSWFVENFKSAKDRVELSLAPLTVFAGANSSGKSTILQSILLAKQTFQYSNEVRPLALNGPILKLGRFDDIKHVNASERYIGLGGTFVFHRDLVSKKVSPRSYQSLSSYFAGILSDEFSSVSFESRLAVAENDDSSQLQPNLIYGALSGTHVAEIEQSPSDDESKPASTDGQRVQRPDTFLVIRSLQEQKSLPHGETKASQKFVGRPRYEISSVDKVTKAEAFEDRPGATLMGAIAHHFLPAGLVVEFDINKQRAMRVAEAISNLHSTNRGRLREFETQRIPRSLFDQILQHLHDAGVPAVNQLTMFDTSKEEGPTLTEAISFLQSAVQAYRAPARPMRSPPSLVSRQPWRIALQELQPLIAEKMIENLGPRKETENVHLESIDIIIQYLDHYFSGSIGYLGPLRDEPKPLYPLEAISDPTDVGYHGEHTAAVLELNRDQTVSYLPPSAMQNGDEKKNPIQKSLHDATVDWLSYLGVAEDISTSDLGKFGHGMQVLTDGVTKSHDLTNVGVGVSQVLPIVVMALLAQDRSLLIFEQPELHLHPKVQSRLADFFMSLAIQGKQCIVETHSEYLIQRIRRRIAESQNSELLDQTQIYFVAREDGQSKYTPIEISEYGAILNWPRDFFDQGDKEVEKIIEASSKKQTRKKLKDKNI